VKILQISKYYPPAPGGIETFVRDISHALTAEGHDNLILAHQYDSTDPSDASGPMGRIVRTKSYGEVMYAPLAPGFPLALHRLLGEFKPDLLLVHMPNVSGFWPLFMKLPCPMAIYWHSDVVFPNDKPLHNLAYKGYSQFERQLLRKADRIIATSEPYLSHSKPLKPFRGKCEVIPLGIDHDRIPAISAQDIARAKQSFLGNEKASFVYAAGRFSHYKGFDRLVKAAFKVSQTHPDLRFVIGGDGETRQDILRQIRSLGLDDYVFCPGRLSDHDYWALMAGCELFCLPSIERSEAFGIVLLEAMSMGKPCISTAIPGSGTGWVNKDGITGRVVQPDNPDAIARTILSLIEAEKTFGPEKIRQYGLSFSTQSVVSQLTAS